jgi:Bacterial EndoU nuclease
LLNKNARLTQVVNPPDVNGVYEARMEMKTPDGRWVAKASNGGINTMFPKERDAHRVKAEIESAWGNQMPTLDSNKWIGKSASGITIEGYRSPRATAYPVKGN